MAVNPKGYVPALRLDDGSVLTEGPAIVQYLADQKPATKLAPAAGTIDRYRLQEWLTFIGTELHKNFGPLFNKATPDAVKDAAKTNITKRLALSQRPAREAAVSVGRHVHGGRCVCIHDPQLDEFRRHGSEGVSERGRVFRAHRSATESAGSTSRRRVDEVTLSTIPRGRTTGRGRTR